MKPVLIVDDEAIMRESLRDWLKDEGYQVETAEQGEEALQRIGEVDFGVIVLDLRLPGKDGIEVLKEARAQRPQLKGIIITAYPSVETAVEAMKLGALDYLPKPVAPDALEKLIRETLGPVQVEIKPKTATEEIEVTETKPLLIVEDEAIMRESLRDWLKDEGYQVETAEQGEEALQRIGEVDFGVVVLDLRLPGKDGLEVLKEARAQRPQLKGIIITAYPSVETAVEAMKLGALDYLPKPVVPDALEKLILETLGPVQVEIKPKTAIAEIVEAPAVEEVIAIPRVLERAIKLNEDQCGRCQLCYSICPFEAISLDTNTGLVIIDIEKCQVCGICASICPTNAIESAYYDYKSLTDYVREQMKALETKTLVIMCRGSSPPSCEILDVLKEQNVRGFIPLRTPCVGRLSTEFYLQALLLGINKIITVQCDADFCRFDKGSEINTRRVLLLRALLKQLGFGSDVLTIIKNPLKAVYDAEKCVGCDKCEFICPYKAIEAQPLATPQINFEACKGCGACALVCPHLAIQLKGFEYQPSSQAIQKYRAEVENLKVKGISPVVLVFCCQWAEFSALDHSRDGFVRENAIIVEIPCYKGLDPVHVLEALRSGFDGVLAIVCSEEDCKLKEGRETAERNVSALRKVLGKLDLAERFEICTASPRYIGDFDSKLESFIAKIASLLKMGRGVFNYV